MRYSKSYPVRLCARLKLFDYRLPSGAMHRFIVLLLRKLVPTLRILGSLGSRHVASSSPGWLKSIIQRCTEFCGWQLQNTTQLNLSLIIKVVCSGVNFFVPCTTVSTLVRWGVGACDWCLPRTSDRLVSEKGDISNFCTNPERYYIMSYTECHCSI